VVVAPLTSGLLEARRGTADPAGSSAYAERPDVARETLGPRAPAQETGYQPSPEIKNPKVLKEAKPGYTADAMRAGIQGSILLEVVVLRDGTVGDVTVTRSLDAVKGLDNEAVRAVKKWRFEPGTKEGKPVPVRVEIEMTFRLKSSAPR